MRLAQRLMQRYPWDESSMAESSCAWTDVELTGETEEAVFNIGITSEMLDEVLPVVVTEANALGLHVLDYQSGNIHLADSSAYDSLQAGAGATTDLRMLGRSYLSGKGVKRNRAAAYALFSLAGQGASEDLSSLAKTMQPKHIEFAKKLALQMSTTSQHTKVLAAFEQANEKSYQAAYEAGRVEDYATALRQLRPLAANGHPDAQFMLGLMALEGRGVNADPKQAFQYFLQSAQGGNAMAQYNLAHAYENGNGVDTDIDKAHRWYKQAASQGYSRSVAALNRLSGKSQSIPPEEFKFQTTTHKAEQNASGDLVITGSISTDRLVELAIGNSEKMLQLRRNAEQGDASAQHQMGYALLEGKEVPRAPNEVAKWLRMAADQGHADAQFCLGEMYRVNVLPKDLRLATSWLTKAAEQGQAEALYSLGIMYQEGDGVPQDYIAALALWTFAKSKGFMKVTFDADDQEKKAALALLEKMLRPGNLQAALKQHAEGGGDESADEEIAAEETKKLQRGRNLLAVAFLLHGVTVLVELGHGSANVQGVFWILAAIVGTFGVVKIIGPMRYSPLFERLLKLLILGPVIGLLASLVVGLHATWKLRSVD